jgi:radical SAM-linked protein
MVRANIDVEFTNGYNPKVKFEFGPALPVGFESDHEYFNFYPKNHYECDELMRILNSKNIDNLEIKEVKEVENRKLSRTIDGFVFDLSLSSDENIELNPLIPLLTIENLIEQKVIKNGFVEKIDVKIQNNKIIAKWITKFKDGQYGSPKSILKLDEFENFYLECNKSGIMWKSF